MDMDIDGKEDTELQSFLELDDDEMKALVVVSNIRNDKIQKSLGVGKGRASTGAKRPYDTYPPSTAFIDVK